MVQQGGKVAAPPANPPPPPAGTVAAADPSTFDLAEMIDLALCSPEVGAVNFNILRIFLHELLGKLGVAKEKAGLDEAQAQYITKFKNYIEKTGKAAPLPGVLRYSDGGVPVPKIPVAKPHTRRPPQGQQPPGQPQYPQDQDHPEAQEHVDGQPVPPAQQGGKAPAGKKPPPHPHGPQKGIHPPQHGPGAPPPAGESIPAEGQEVYEPEYPETEQPAQEQQPGRPTSRRPTQELDQSGVPTTEGPIDSQPEGQPMEVGPEGATQATPQPPGATQAGPRPHGPAQARHHPPGPAHVGPHHPPGPPHVGPRPPGPAHVGPHPPGPAHVGPHPPGATQAGPYPPGATQAGPQPPGSHPPTTGAPRASLQGPGTGHPSQAGEQIPPQPAQSQVPSPQTVVLQAPIPLSTAASTADFEGRMSVVEKNLKRLEDGLGGLFAIPIVQKYLQGQKSADNLPTDQQLQGGPAPKPPGQMQGPTMPRAPSQLPAQGPRIPGQPMQMRPGAPIPAQQGYPPPGYPAPMQPPQPVAAFYPPQPGYPEQSLPAPGQPAQQKPQQGHPPPMQQMPAQPGAPPQQLYAPPGAPPQQVYAQPGYQQQPQQPSVPPQPGYQQQPQQPGITPQPGHQQPPQQPGMPQQPVYQQQPQQSGMPPQPVYQQQPQQPGMPPQPVYQQQPQQPGMLPQAVYQQPPQQPGTPMPPQQPGKPVPPQQPGKPMPPQQPGMPMPQQQPGMPMPPQQPGMPMPPQPVYQQPPQPGMSPQPGYQYPPQQPGVPPPGYQYPPQQPGMPPQPGYPPQAQPQQMYAQPGQAQMPQPQPGAPPQQGQAVPPQQHPAQVPQVPGQQAPLRPQGPSQPPVATQGTFERVQSAPASEATGVPRKTQSVTMGTQATLPKGQSKQKLAKQGTPPGKPQAQVTYAAQPSAPQQQVLAQPGYQYPQQQPGYQYPQQQPGMPAQPGYQYPQQQPGMPPQPGYQYPQQQPGMPPQPGYEYPQQPGYPPQTQPQDMQGQPGQPAQKPAQPGQPAPPAKKTPPQTQQMSGQQPTYPYPMQQPGYEYPQQPQQGQPQPAYQYPQQTQQGQPQPLYQYPQQPQQGQPQPAYQYPQPGQQLQQPQAQPQYPQQGQQMQPQLPQPQYQYPQPMQQQGAGAQMPPQYPPAYPQQPQGAYPAPADGAYQMQPQQYAQAQPQYPGMPQQQYPGYPQAGYAQPQSQRLMSVVTPSKAEHTSSGTAPSLSQSDPGPIREGSVAYYPGQEPGRVQHTHSFAQFIGAEPATQVPSSSLSLGMLPQFSRSGAIDFEAKVRLMDKKLKRLEKGLGGLFAIPIVTQWLKEDEEDEVAHMDELMDAIELNNRVSAVEEAIMKTTHLMENFAAELANCKCDAHGIRRDAQHLARTNSQMGVRIDPIDARSTEAFEMAIDVKKELDEMRIQFDEQIEKLKELGIGRVPSYIGLNQEEMGLHVPPYQKRELAHYAPAEKPFTEPKPLPGPPCLPQDNYGFGNSNKLAAIKGGLGIDDVQMMLNNLNTLELEAANVKEKLEKMEKKFKEHEDRMVTKNMLDDALYEYGSNRQGGGHGHGDPNEKPRSHVPPHYAPKANTAKQSPSETASKTTKYVAASGSPSGTAAPSAGAAPQHGGNLLGIDDIQIIFNHLSNLVIEHSAVKERLDKVDETFKEMENLMVSKTMLVDALNEKADKSLLNSKVTYDEFSSSMDDIKSKLQNLLVEVYSKNETWKSITDRIEEELTEKLDKIEIGPLRAYFKNHLGKLEEKVHYLTRLIEEPDPAGTRKKFLKDYNCLSCDRHTNISGVTNGSLLPVIPPTLGGYSTASQRAFELYQMRGNKPSDMKGQGDDRGNGPQGLRDTEVAHLVNRYVGGSHTAISSAERLAALHNKTIPTSPTPYGVNVQFNEPGTGGGGSGSSGQPKAGTPTPRNEKSGMYADEFDE